VLWDIYCAVGRTTVCLINLKIGESGPHTHRRGANFPAKYGIVLSSQLHDILNAPGQREIEKACDSQKRTIMEHE
jgi:hypothetical protein